MSKRGAKKSEEHRAKIGAANRQLDFPCVIKSTQRKAVREEIREKQVVLIFLCPGCEKEVAFPRSRWLLERRSGYCRSCGMKRKPSHQKRPFEARYNMLCSVARHRKLAIELTYEQYLTFTTELACHYCRREINWELLRSNLDRKDNALGYSRENCVVCCKPCNYLKANKFSYEQMMRLSPILQQFAIEGQY